MELNTAANVLLGLAYMQHLDEQSLQELELPHKKEAMQRLLKEGLLVENEVALPEGTYRFYDLTGKGEQMYESEGFKTGKRAWPIVQILLVASIITVLSVTALLLYTMARAK